MSLRDDIRVFISSFGRIPEPEPAPPPTPRTPPQGLAGTRARVSLDDEQSLVASTLSIVAPLSADDTWRSGNLDANTLDQLPPGRILELLTDISPDISRALWDFLRLCNPGWTATAYVGDALAPQAAQDALNAFLARVKVQHGAIDVVINRLWIGGFLRGGFLAELVLDTAGRAPLDIATPDPGSLRFKRVQDPELGQVWQFGQWQFGQWVPFDRPTIRYVPIDPLPAHPEGRSLAAPALFPCLFLIGLLHDLRRVVAQQGYPRLDLEVKLQELIAAMPDDIKQDPDAFRAWVNDTIGEVQRVYSALQPDDSYIHTDVVKVNRPVGAVDASSLGAIDGLIQALERQSVRALKTMPLLMAVAQGTSETMANRQWEVHAAGIKALQHLVEGALETLLTLALQAQGIGATVQFRFAELRAAELLRDAQVQSLTFANAALAYAQGWVSQDGAAQMAVGHPADAPAPRTSASTTAGSLATVQADPGSTR